MTLLLDNSTGLEQLQLSVFKTLHENVNVYIAAEEQTGNAIDAQVAIYGNSMTTTLETFDARFIHYGHRPSMIEAPVTEYPSMSVMAYSASPAAANSTADYGYSVALRCAVEFIVKSGPYDPNDRTGVGEDLLGRRTKRTTEAISRLMQDHSSLGGTFMPPETAPTITLGDVFEREEDGETVTGARWYWQGVRMDYIYLKQTTFSND